MFFKVIKKVFLLYILLTKVYINYNNKYISLKNNEQNQYLILFFNATIKLFSNKINIRFNEHFQIGQNNLNNNLKSYTFNKIIGIALINVINSQFKK